MQKIPKHILAKLPKAKLFQGAFLGRDTPFLFKKLRLKNTVRFYFMGFVCDIRAPWHYEMAKAQHPELFPGESEWQESFARMARLLSCPQRLMSVYRSHRKWSDSTFGSRNEKGPIGPLKHLKDECDEAIENPDDISEFADLQFLLWDAASRAGHDIVDLTEACEDKLRVLVTRKYPKVPDGEPSFHLKDGGEK
jgi:hypothetical protein